MVTVNGYEVLEKVTGISKEEQVKILEDIKENHRKLDSCGYHQFIIPIKGRTSFDTKYKCPYCEGIVSAQEKKWYELGRLHEERKNSK